MKNTVKVKEGLIQMTSGGRQFVRTGIFIIHAHKPDKIGSG